MPNEGVFPRSIHLDHRRDEHALDLTQHLRADAQRELRAVFSDVKPPRVTIELPKIDYTVFGEAEARTRQTCEMLEKWLRIPYIADSFGTNHTLRRAWRRDFVAQYGTVGKQELKPWTENKYRANILARPSLFIEGLRMKLEDTSGLEPLAIEIGRIWNDRATLESLEQYPTMEVEQREQVIHEMEDRVIDVLRTIVEEAQHLAAEKGMQEAATEPIAAK